MILQQIKIFVCHFLNFKNWILHKRKTNKASRLLTPSLLALQFASVTSINITDLKETGTHTSAASSHVDMT